MKKKWLLTTGNLLLAILLHSQTETFDIASYTVPEGWQRLDSNGIRVIHDILKVNDQVSFCQIFLYPSKQGSGNITKDFNDAWAELVTKTTGSKTKPKTETQKTADGWTVVTGHDEVNTKGIRFNAIVISMSGFGKVMNVLVNVAGKEYGTAIGNFFNSFELNKNKMADNTAKAPVNSGTINGFDDYAYTVPEKWVIQKTNDCIYLIQQQGNSRGCYISLFAPQPASGSLENDVKNYFGQMYKGWQFLRAGGDILTKGYNLKGVEYCMMEGSMMKPKGDGYSNDYEEGGVLLFQMGNQLAVMTIRHEITGLYCECRKNYDTWARFLNSFSAKHFSGTAFPKDGSAGIVGSWIVSGGRSLSNYIFAANGRYQYIGAFGSTTRIDDRTIEMKSSAFQGDGKYSLKDSTLIITGDSRKNNPDVYRIRFEQINQGSSGWKDRFYLFNPHPIDGGKPYEACYEKSVTK